jgi:hypothetical protein
MYTDSLLDWRLRRNGLVEIEAPTDVSRNKIRASWDARGLHEPA